MLTARGKFIALRELELKQAFAIRHRRRGVKLTRLSILSPTTLISSNSRRLSRLLTSEARRSSCQTQQARQDEKKNVSKNGGRNVAYATTKITPIYLRGCRHSRHHFLHHAILQSTFTKAKAVVTAVAKKAPLDGLSGHTLSLVYTSSRLRYLPIPAIAIQEPKKKKDGRAGRFRSEKTRAYLHPQPILLLAQRLGAVTVHAARVAPSGVPREGTLAAYPWGRGGDSDGDSSIASSAVRWYGNNTGTIAVCWI